MEHPESELLSFSVHAQGMASLSSAAIGDARADFESTTPGAEWLLLEEGFTLAREHEIESLFAIANGYIGNRGSLAEGSPLSAPATFAAGVFELHSEPGAVPGLFVLPDWTGVRAWIQEHALSIDQGQMIEHRRILDMFRGTLRREWLHRDINGRVTRVRSWRLASLADRHLLAHSVTFTPENYSGQIRLENSIELPPHVQTCPPREEYKARRSAMRPNVLPLAMRSPGRDAAVAFGTASQLIVSKGKDQGRREIEITDRRITERFTVQAEIGADYHLDRLVAIYSTRGKTSEQHENETLEAACAHVNRMLPAGVAGAVSEHVLAWENRWRAADVTVEGDDTLQRALRFAQYHLIGSANPEDDHVSIGARALTGEAYKGHVFWDTEIFMLPFYIFTCPEAARALLKYRYHTLPAARQKAREAGYKGAMYPWESADTGEEVTPRFVIDPSGQVIPVLNGEMENHITTDIAYGVWQYWNVSADDAFFLDAGAEIVLETARFWASRGVVKADGLYHIRHVIGPDEYHDDVDDNAYTNLMAAWNLERGVETAGILQERWPEFWNQLAPRLQLTPEEIASWSRCASAVYRGFDADTKLFEQHQGFFQLKKIDLTAYETRNTAMDVILGHNFIQGCNVVKQADVVMAMYLLWDQFPAEVRDLNYCYYEPLTGHGSSLSPSIHALMAARLGRMTKAEKYLRQAAEIDLGNNMGNAAGGVHAAALGGLWQAMVMGFGGCEIHSEGLYFNPHLLPHWRRLTFPLRWRDCQLRVSIEPSRIAVQAEKGAGTPTVRLPGGREVMIRGGRQFTASRNGLEWSGWQERRL